MEREGAATTGAQTVQNLTVIYDNHCKFCIRCASWIVNEPQVIPLEVIPMWADSTKNRFPGLCEELRIGQFVVVSDSGDVYFDTKGKIMVLYALYRYRPLSYTQLRSTLLDD